MQLDLESQYKHQMEYALRYLENSSAAKSMEYVRDKFKNDPRTIQYFENQLERIKRKVLRNVYNALQNSQET